MTDQEIAEAKAGIDTYLKELGGETSNSAEEQNPAQPEGEKQPEETPAAESQPPQETAPEAEGAPEEDDPWKTVIPEATKEVQEEDWKSKYEEVHSKLTARDKKLEQHKFLKTLEDVVDAPGFDPEKFFDAYTTKRVDYASVPLENLYKASLEGDKVANYTDDDIEAMWLEKKAELDGKPHLEKTLKSSLVKEFQDSEPKTDDEPELIKNWREQRVEAQKKEEENFQEHKRVTEGVKTFNKSLIGKNFGGYTVTEDDAKEADKLMDINTFKKADGKLDEIELGKRRMESVLFRRMFPNLVKNAKKEAIKGVTRPSTSTISGNAAETDGRTENEKILDAYAQQNGKKSHKDLQQ